MKSLTTNELMEALEWTRVHLPQSAIMYSWLKAITSSPPKLTNPIAFVDSWPNPRVIAGINFVGSYGLKDFPHISLFADVNKEDENIVENFLLELSYILKIKEVGGIEAHAIQFDSIPVCRRVFCERLGLNTIKEEWGRNLYWLDEESRRLLTTKDIQPPPGFEFDRLDVSESELVNSVWPHRFEGSQKYMHHRIEYFPNVCLRKTTPEGKILAGFELMQDYMGTLNNLYTLPDFRRGGLGSLIEQKQCQEMIKCGYIPVKTVVFGNLKAEKMTEASPWWKNIGQVSWARYGNERGKRLFEEISH